MRKLNLILGALSGLFILCLAHLVNRNSALESELAANRLRCEQQSKRLQNDYQAEIDDLRQYLQQQYSGSPSPVLAGTRQGTDDSEQSAAADPEGKSRQSAQKTDHKYRYLYDDLPDLRDAGAEMLRQLVLQREELGAAGDPNNAERLGGIEAQIGELLGAEGFQKYQVLKTSDNEQHHLEEYAKTLDAEAPLTAEQERSLLMTKLRHKQVYENTLQDAGVYWGKWSEQERANLQTVINKAVDTYKNNYLQEARQFLSAAQFDKLRIYETTEFSWEQQRLLRLISSKH
jgi:hypothetical protein